MSTTELFFLDLGLGFSASKGMAYLIYPLIGLLSWFFIKRFVKKSWMRVLLLVLAIGGPFGAYFALHPIYEGDFSNNGVSLDVTSELDSLQAPRLVVISIPNCPYCQESVGRMLDLKKRYPKLQVEYRICVSDSLAREAVAHYKQLAKNTFVVKQANNTEQLVKIADSRFPTFVYLSGSKKTKWANDDFGAGALDEIVGELK